jgi:branched-chain amino acid transport system substrate-binding protein
VGCQAANYTALYQGVKSSGADMVYVAGIYHNNGGQLIKDKVAAFGDNSGSVKLFAPDGFTGYPDMLKLPESAGMYLAFLGLTQDQLVRSGGARANLLDSYETKYGKAPDGSFPLYRVAAAQVIPTAIATSDGTRKPSARPETDPRRSRPREPVAIPRPVMRSRRRAAGPRT